MPAEYQNDEVGWAAEEFFDVDLDDKRLDRRCQVLVEKLGKQPMVSINQACEDWSDSKAAYRFVDNEKVSARKLLEPHIKRTVERIKSYPVVLAIQDTTFLNFSGHPKTKNLGEIGAKWRKEAKSARFWVAFNLGSYTAGTTLGDVGSNHIGTSSRAAWAQAWRSTETTH